MKMKWLAFVAALLIPAAITTAVPSAEAATPTSPFVVVVKATADPAAVAASVDTTPTFVYRSAITGFAAALTPSQKTQLAKASDVVSISADSPLSVSDNGAQSATAALKTQQVPAGVRRIGALASPTAAIDGVDTRVNVDVAVLDSGIDGDHPDLPNLAGGVNCTSEKGVGDQLGHGTFVAGEIAALDNKIGVVGVAPGARLWSVKVINRTGTGTVGQLVCGVDWVTAHSDVIHLANVSIVAGGIDDGACGTTNGDVLHQAICNSVAHGVTYVVGAGNGATDASTTIPAAYSEVITVSAFADYDGLPGGLANATCPDTTPDDAFASWFSNFGPGVDFTAPGVCVLSTLPDRSYGVHEGTSMSTPYVTGAAALYLANHPGASPAQVKQALLTQADLGGAIGDPDIPPTPIVNAAGL
jgi:subtilisin family serine protease